MISLIFDTETTGLPLHPTAKAELQPRIIEWGGMLVNEEGVELLALNFLIDPEIPIPAVITKITGITAEDLVGAQKFSEVAGLIHAMFENADQIIAHNLPFDSSLMRFELARCGLLERWPWPKIKLCTVQEHAEMWGRRPKLTELYEFYMGEPLAQTHRAIDDVRALRDVCIKSGVLK
jgi:DNA polymerase III epsilon subunit-like protein